MSSRILVDLSIAARLAAVGGALLAAGGCSLDPSFLFADIPAIPAVVHILPAEGDYVVPAVITSREEIGPNTIYAEVGAPADAQMGGATLNFRGTGRDVCIWVDPEVAFWNQAISANPNADGRKWTYPDNIYDDGDMDLFVGRSVFYTGSPGEVMGDFILSYKDSLGNEIPIEYLDCGTRSSFGVPNAQAGRATPDYCTVFNSDLDVSYTVAMSTFSTPLDDDRMGFGILLFDGDCQELKNIAGGGTNLTEECVIQGEAIVPDGEDWGPWYGYDDSRVAAGSVEFESAYCGGTLPEFCAAEAELVAEEDAECGWSAVGEEYVRCFCGDPNDTPKPGEG